MLAYKYRPTDEFWTAECSNTVSDRDTGRYRIIPEWRQKGIIVKRNKRRANHKVYIISKWGALWRACYINRQAYKSMTLLQSSVLALGRAADSSGAVAGLLKALQTHSQPLSEHLKILYNIFKKLLYFYFCNITMITYTNFDSVCQL